MNTPASPPAPRVVDLTGHAFGRLTVVTRAPNQHGAARWVCTCTCGTTMQVRGDNLRTGHTTSCGCQRGAWRQSKQAGQTADGAGCPSPAPVPAPKPAIRVELCIGKLAAFEFGCAVVLLPEPQGFELGVDVPPAILVPAMPRKKIRGPLPATLARGMHMLAAAGHIAARGERTLGRWARDENVSWTTRMTSRGDEEIRREYAKIQAEYTA